MTRLPFQKTTMITWLTFKQVYKKTVTLFISISVFVLFFGIINWILQQSFIFKGH